MYKRLFLAALLITAIVTSSGCTSTHGEKSDVTEHEYVRAVWIAYYEMAEFTENNSDASQFKKAVTKAFKDLKSKGFNCVTLQVRPFADAFYKSKYFPSSAYCFGKQGGELYYDPLEIMTEVAHKYSLSVEAWINPYRVHSSADFSALSENNPALEFKDSEDLIVCDSGIYFNPASSQVNELIINGVKEIAENYRVDSICFDDYFYPVTDKSIDKNYYEQYKKDGGQSSLDDWRRDNVSNMVSSVYKAIKSINPQITFGISPASNIENNYSSLYADVEKWAANEGYADYLCPQVYFGFQNETQPFMTTVKQWAEMTKCELYIALPLYKAGLEDEFAGDAGINEFTENNNILARQVIYLSKLDKVGGFYIFS